VWYTKCRRIYERPLFQRLRHKRHGKILRHSRAMSGSAGSYQARKRRQGVSVSRKHSRSSKAECAGLVVGSVALTVESDTLDVFQSFLIFNSRENTKNNRVPSRCLSHRGLCHRCLFFSENLCAPRSGGPCDRRTFAACCSVHNRFRYCVFHIMRNLDCSVFSKKKKVGISSF
jgi:hypothetical protein